MANDLGLRYFYVCDTSVGYIKLGITTRPLGHRLRGYDTYLPRPQFHAAARFDGIEPSMLRQIEAKCLEATYAFLPADLQASKPRHECRYNITASAAWDECVKHFPTGWTRASTEELGRKGEDAIELVPEEPAPEPKAEPKKEATKTTRVCPGQIVLCPSTSKSAHDYVIEKPYFAAGGHRWRCTLGGREKIGDRFGYTNVHLNRIEVFEIVTIYVGEADVQSHFRHGWNKPIKLWPKLLEMGPKLGEIPFDALYTQLGLYHGKGPMGTTICEWLPALEALIA